MDTQAYISSGVIESYVMGFATEEETQILECIQKYNPEVRLAVFEAQQAMEELVTQHAVAPPKHLKNTIWNAIKEAEISENKSVGEEKTSVFTVSREKNSSPQRNFKPIAVAASVLLLISVSIIAYEFQKQGKLENQLAALENQAAGEKQKYAQLEQKWEMSTNSGMRTVLLEGVENHPGMRAMVYVEKTTNQTYLSIENLPVAPEGFQYQLWAIVDGKPVDAGLYDAASTTLIQKMLTVDNPDAFAITLEKAGGNPTPTMEQLYVIGEI